MAIGEVNSSLLWKRKIIHLNGRKNLKKMQRQNKEQIAAICQGCYSYKNPKGNQMNLKFFNFLLLF